MHLLSGVYNKKQQQSNLQTTTMSITKQFYEQIVNITLQNTPTILAKIKTLLPALSDHYLKRLWKALFMALWNYDKMIHQHHFNTQLSNLIHILNPEQGLLFFRHAIRRLNTYWQRVDHHRINKFMQLLRYILKQTVRFAVDHSIELGTIHKILLQEAFQNLQQLSGFDLNILDLYVDVVNEGSGKNSQALSTVNLYWILKDLVIASPNKNYRQYVFEHIYEKIKSLLGEAELQKLKNEVLELTKTLELEQIRKSLYDLYGFLKSTQTSFREYMQRKKQNKQKNYEGTKRKKKITKGKKEEITKLKDKRKKNKTKAKKIISKNTLQMGQQ